MLEEQSLNWISKQGGIPYTTLWRFAHGKANLPEKYHNSIFNVYGQEAFTRSIVYGISEKEAKKLALMTPERLTIRLGEYIDKINILTERSVARRLYREGKEMTMKNITKIWNEQRQKVIDSIVSHERTMKNVLSEKY